jgi:aspartate oxidase
VSSLYAQPPSSSSEEAGVNGEGSSGALSSEQVDGLWRTVKEAMWRDVGIVRETTDLKRSAAALAGLAAVAEAAYASAALALARGPCAAASDKSAPLEALSGLRNAAAVAAAISAAAAANLTSVGTHYIAPILSAAPRSMD